jgi:histidyl-tRNA synthetase
MDRLLAGIEALGKNARRGSYTKLIILNMDASLEPEYQAAAAGLRAAGISAELFLDQRKLGQQYGYAEKKGIPYAIIRGAEEQARGVWLLRDMATRENSEYGSVEALAAALKAALSGHA